MSAFIVNSETIGAIASYAQKEKCCQYGILYGKGIIEAEKIAEVLANENIRSVCSRYGSADDMADPMFVSRCKDDAKKTYPHITFGQLAKHVNCLEYQSCETDNYYSTDAYKILVCVRNSLAHDLAGYESAQWG